MAMAFPAFPFLSCRSSCYPSYFPFFQFVSRPSCPHRITPSALESFLLSCHFIFLHSPLFLPSFFASFRSLPLSVRHILHPLHPSVVFIIFLSSVFLSFYRNLPPSPFFLCSPMYQLPFVLPDHFSFCPFIYLPYLPCYPYLLSRVCTSFVPSLVPSDRYIFYFRWCV